MKLNQQDQRSNLNADPEVEGKRLHGNVLADALVLSNLGKGLRAIYMDAVREPLPQTFMTLLKRVEEVHKGTVRQLRRR